MLGVTANVPTSKKFTEIAQMQCTEKGIENASINIKYIYIYIYIYIYMFIQQSMNSFFIYQCTDYKLNVVAFISEVLYVYYVCLLYTSS